MVTCGSFSKDLNTYTYKKKEYFSTIDHILVRNKEKNSVQNFKITLGPDNLSDHNPISCEFDFYNSEETRPPNKDFLKPFHRFNWKNTKFTELYNLTLSNSLKPFINKIADLQVDDTTQVNSLLDEIFLGIPRLMLKTARESEKCLGLSEKIHNSKKKIKLNLDLKISNACLLQIGFYI